MRNSRRKLGGVGFEEGRGGGYLDDGGDELQEEAWQLEQAGVEVVEEVHDESLDVGAVVVLVRHYHQVAVPQLLHAFVLLHSRDAVRGGPAISAVLGGCRPHDWAVNTGALAVCGGGGGGGAPTIMFTRQWASMCGWRVAYQTSR